MEIKSWCANKQLSTIDTIKVSELYERILEIGMLDSTSNRQLKNGTIQFTDLSSKSCDQFLIYCKSGYVRRSYISQGRFSRGHRYIYPINKRKFKERKSYYGSSGKKYYYGTYDLIKSNDPIFLLETLYKYLLNRKKRQSK